MGRGAIPLPVFQLVVYIRWVDHEAEPEPDKVEQSWLWILCLRLLVLGRVCNVQERVVLKLIQSKVVRFWRTISCVSKEHCCHVKFVLCLHVLFTFKHVTSAVEQETAPNKDDYDESMRAVTRAKEAKPVWRTIRGYQHGSSHVPP